MKASWLTKYRWLAVALAAATTAVAQIPSRPNVILMMTDDMGWGDVDFPQRLSSKPTNPAHAVYAGHPTLRTPHLRAMAQAGMQFHRFYSPASVCSPTRASFLTGRHHWRMGIEWANESHLFNREITVAELAKSIGYRTGHFGKWHLGTLDYRQFSTDSNRGGTSQLPGSALNYAPPWSQGYDTVFCTEAKVPTYNPTVNFSPATRFWVGPRQALPLNDPALAGDDSRVIMNQVLPFIRTAAAERQRFFATVWFHTPHKPLLSDPNDPRYSGTDDHLFTSLDEMDAQVGRIRQELRSLGIENETLLVFCSDNGATGSGSTGNGPRVGGLRGNKTDLYEGGVRVPGLFEWPGQIALRSQTDAISSAIDFLPTLLDIWRIEMPEARALDGESLLPIMFGTATQRRGSLRFRMRNNARSIVDAAGRFKAIRPKNTSGWKLYDLIADPKETTNLATSNAATLASLTAEWNAWNTEIVNQRNNNEIDFETGITQLSGAAIRVDDPVDFRPGAERGSVPQVVVERQYATLNTPLAVDADGRAAIYDGSNQPPGGTIPAGSVVHSYLIHFDPGSTLTRTVTLTFADPILGIIGDTNRLVASDFLAFRDPDFDPGTRRGSLVGEAGDTWTVQSGGRAVHIAMSASATLDEVRVLTLSPLQAGLRYDGSAVGTSCGGRTSVSPTIRFLGPLGLGTTLGFALDGGVPSSTMNTLLLGMPGTLNLSGLGLGKCSLHMRSAPIFSALGLVTDAAGNGSVTLPINPSPALSGLVLRFQWIMFDTAFQLATTDAIELTIN